MNVEEMKKRATDALGHIDATAEADEDEPDFDAALDAAQLFAKDITALAADVLALIAENERLRLSRAALDDSASREILSLRNEREKTIEAINRLTIERDALKADVERLTKEVALDNELLGSHRQIFDAEPCPAHGPCVPHIVETLGMRKVAITRLSEANKSLAAERDALKLEVERLRIEIAKPWEKFACLDRNGECTLAGCVVHPG